jgi:hypothetical protein
MGYLAYLPFQVYSCQVLIKVISVKNVISFQGYFEQIPLIPFLKRTQEGQTAWSKQDFDKEANPSAQTQRTFEPLPRTQSTSAGLA